MINAARSTRQARKPNRDKRICDFCHYILADFLSLSISFYYYFHCFEACIKLIALLLHTKQPFIYFGFIEYGDDVDFTSVPSPVHHENPVSAPPQSQRKVDIERKARLAALAQEFNNREDDFNHPIISRLFE